MHTKRRNGKTAFDYFAEECFKMGCEGYRNITEKQLGAYKTLGSENYREITYAAFEHAFISATVSGTRVGSRNFKTLYRTVLDGYCDGLVKRYYSLRRKNPESKNKFIYIPPTRRQMILDVERKLEERLQEKLLVSMNF